VIGGAVIVVARVLFRIVFGGGVGEHVLFTLPEFTLPRAAAGIRLFGPVATEQVLSGFYDGLRLATMLICVGAANALANPKRVLRTVPGALYEVGTAVIVAISVAPQLVESVLRVRRARRLRGGRERGLRALKGIAIPVLVDAMDRSLRLAAGMDSRGFGRTAGQSRRSRRASGALLIIGLGGVSVGLYGLLDGTAPRALGVPVLLAGSVVAVAGLAVSGRRVRRSVYRPDRWRATEFAVAGCGVVAAFGLLLTLSVDPANLYPSLSPLAWPSLPLVATAGVLVGGLPAWIAPPPVPTTTAARVPAQAVPRVAERTG
jgi:energy-coupling factor transport system permease protein